MMAVVAASDLFALDAREPPARRPSGGRSSTLAQSGATAARACVNGEWRGIAKAPTGMR
nr:hypothetical protein JVH1_8415 [Rhodococcus sp. JVH1]